MKLTDFEIRPMGQTDVQLWCDAVDLFRGALVDEEEMTRFMAEPSIVGYLAVGPSSTIVGWSWGHLHRHIEGFSQGQLYDIEVSLSHRRTGLGSTLLKAMRLSFKELGARRMWLFTDEDNTAAKALYQGCDGVASPHDDATYWWQL